MKTWFITGVSRGLGLALAQAVLSQGDQVVGTVRTDAPQLHGRGDSLRLLKVDMSDEQGVIAAVHQAFAAFGSIDVIVNNAGYGLMGAVENASDDEVRALFDVNVLTPIRIIRTALPYLRAQRSGHIINMTSIAGRAPGLGSAVYAASKFALEGFSAALHQEMTPLGVTVTAVAPGQFRTDFLASTAISQGSSQADYADTVGAALTAMSQLHQQQLGDPDLAARAIVELACCPRPPLHLLLGSDALERARRKMSVQREEMDAWETVTRSTDFKD